MVPESTTRKCTKYIWRLLPYEISAEDVIHVMGVVTLSIFHGAAEDISNQNNMKHRELMIILVENYCNLLSNVIENE